MSEAIQTTPAQSAVIEPNAVSDYPVVVRCCEVRDRVYREQKARRKDDYNANKEAANACRNTMPSLSGYENICNFVVRVAHGILTGAAEAINGTKPLNAAQLALSTVRHQPAPPKPAAA